MACRGARAQVVGAGSMAALGMMIMGFLERLDRLPSTDIGDRLMFGV
jgi:hypothetical protein